MTIITVIPHELKRNNSLMKQQSSTLLGHTNNSNIKKNIPEMKESF